MDKLELQSSWSHASYSQLKDPWDRQSSRNVVFMLVNTIRRMQPLLLCRYCGTESYHALHYKDQQDMTSLDGDVTLERMLRDDLVDRFSLSHTPALPEDTQEHPDYIHYY
jgi:hypothetical protein